MKNLILTTGDFYHLLLYYCKGGMASYREQRNWSARKYSNSMSDSSVPQFSMILIQLA